MLCVFEKLNAEETTSLIVYPKTTHPVSNIYSSTIKGIEKKIKNTKRFEVGKATQLKELEHNLIEISPNNVIALGKVAIELVKKSSYNSKLFVSLIYFKKDEHYGGVSLSIESRLINQFLHNHIPNINKIFIFQDSNLPVLIDNNTPTSIEEVWNTNSLNSLFPSLGYTLEKVASSNDAIVIPANIPGDILYEISKIAWNREIPLISTNLSHLEYGVMLAFHPNMTALGEQLGELSHHPTSSYETVKKLDISLNKRVSDHLKTNFSAESMKQFSVVLE